MKRAALLSVSDRTGLLEFARELSALGFELLCTSGTRKVLEEAGVKVTSIESYTGQKEILDGRVKTLHPKIHAGLLARRDNPAHMAQLAEDGIMPIDVAVINLYPFKQNLHGESVGNPRKMIELVDIGGPTMIRAASKNFTSLFPVIDPADYPRVAAALKQSDWQASSSALELRRELAVKVFTTIADYDLAIAKYFSNVKFDSESGGHTVDQSSEFMLGPVSGAVLVRSQELRYGENPHQNAAWYGPVGETTQGWKQFGGKELSYNNLLDFDAAVRLIRSLGREKPAAAILKHLNPCGAAIASSLLEAVQKSKLGDSRSHFGGVVALNQTVTVKVAEELCADFKEIIVAPGYDEAALKLFSTKKNLRVLEVSLDGGSRYEIRTLQGGALVQQVDPGASPISAAELVSSRPASAAELADLELAWKLCAHVKSNAITLVKDGTLIGTGAGQMSPIDSVEIAISKAKANGHKLGGAVCASDAFFPFTDNIETLAKEGISCVIAPAGAGKDDEVVAKAKELGVSLYFAGDRHFRH